MPYFDNTNDSIVALQSGGYTSFSYSSEVSDIDGSQTYPNDLEVYSLTTSQAVLMNESVLATNNNYSYANFIDVPVGNVQAPDPIDPQRWSEF